MEIIGHYNIWHFLKKTAEKNKISHAYLFLGPDKIGKKTLALELVKLLHCQKENFDERPCNDCNSCKMIKNSSHSDFTLIEPIKKEIKISQIRKLSWNLSLQSHVSPYKTAIIDQAHAMNIEAQSALLKTLEEPRGKTMIILITAWPKLLLPTIISRVEKIKFSLVAKEQIDKYLEKKKVDKKKKEELLSLYFGRPGEIINFLNNPEELEKRNKKVKELVKLINSSLAKRFKYAKEKAADYNDLNETLNIWLEYFREKMIYSVKNESFDNYPLKKLKKIINLIQDTIFLISKTEVNKKLALEMILIEL
jgi:DNA polymerase III subunit delta'